jgi:hypothetical protein
MSRQFLFSVVTYANCNDYTVHYKREPLIYSERHSIFTKVKSIELYLLSIKKLH